MSERDTSDSASLSPLAQILAQPHALRALETLFTEGQSTTRELWPDDEQLHRATLSRRAKSLSPLITEEKTGRTIRYSLKPHCKPLIGVLFAVLHSIDEAIESDIDRQHRISQYLRDFGIQDVSISGDHLSVGTDQIFIVDDNAFQIEGQEALMSLAELVHHFK